MADTTDKLPTNEQVARALGVSVQSTDVGGKVPTLEQLKRVMDGSGGGFTGTATVTLSGGTVGYEYSYIDESFNLVSGASGTSGVSGPKFPLTVPTPQIMYLSAFGRNESMGISGNYDLIRSVSYPAGRVIYIKGDVTITAR